MRVMKYERRTEEVGSRPRVAAFTRGVVMIGGALGGEVNDCEVAGSCADTLRLALECTRRGACEIVRYESAMFSRRRRFCVRGVIVQELSQIIGRL